MAKAYFDLRDRMVRVLVTAPGKPATYQTFEQPLENAEVLRRFAGEVSSACGAVIREVHLIAPDHMVHHGVHRLQQMPEADAEKVLARSIGAESGERSPAVKLLPLASEGGQHSWLVQHISLESLEDLRQMFRAARLRLKTVTTALHAELAVLEPIRRQAFKAMAFFGVGRETVEAVFFLADGIRHYDRLDILPVEEDAEDSGGERDRKRRLFDILNTMHGMLSQYMASHPDFPVEKILLGGGGAGDQELIASLTEATELEVASFSPPERFEIGQDPACTALSGLAAMVEKGDTVNFLPVAMQKRFRGKPGFVAAGVAVLYTMGLLAGVALIERRAAGLRQRIETGEQRLARLTSVFQSSRSQVRDLRVLDKILHERQPFYDLLRTFSSRLPAGLYLEQLEYRHREERRPLLTIRAVCPLENGPAGPRGLSRLMAVLDGIDLLENTSEPEVSVVTRDGTRMLGIVVNCEMPPQRGSAASAGGAGG